MFPQAMPPSGMASGMDSAPPASGSPDLQALLALLTGQEGPGNLPTPPAAGLGGPTGNPQGGGLLELLTALLGGAGSSSDMAGC